jgi:probable phosphoglycerate mutase
MSRMSRMSRMSGTSRILVVRHGQSTWNADGRWQGQADPPLSELGIAQAEAAAGAGSGALDGVDAIWASDLERARHTATILAVPRGQDVVVDARFRERDAGEWTGLTRDQIEEQFPGALSERRRPPGFESDDVLVVRALAALRDLATALAGGTAVVVTHGGVILAVERHHGEERTPVANLEGRWLDVAADGAFVLGDRQILFDPDAVEVTTPGQP